MKISSAILTVLFAQGAVAFTPSRVSTALSAATLDAVEITVNGAEEQSYKYDKYVVDEDSEVKVEEATFDPSIYDPRKRVQTGRYNNKPNSIAIPFLKRPAKLDGTHAGDVGFDPLGFTESYDLYTMMEAEIRHARIAMLAVVGWPLSELVGPKFMLHGEKFVAPSVLNGFDPLSFISVAAIFGAFGYFENKTWLRRVDDKPLGKKHVEDMANVWKYGVPGDYNFDPLNLYSILGDSADGRKAMREAEIAHGRAAMLGITTFAALEAMSGHPIVENNLLFHPNAVVPAAALAYFTFINFYEVKNSDQYLLQPQLTSEGSVRLEELQRKAALATEGTSVYTDIASEYATKYGSIVTSAFNDVKSKYDQAIDDSTKKALKYTDKE